MSEKHEYRLTGLVTYCDCGWEGSTKSALFQHLKSHEETEEAEGKLLREFDSTVNQAIREGVSRAKVPSIGHRLQLTLKFRRGVPKSKGNTTRYGRLIYARATLESRGTGDSL